MRRHLLASFVMFCGLFLNAQTIYNGQDIEQNRKYWADGRQTYLIFQGDGNLVFYNRAGKPLWESKTANRGVRATFQNDGNLVVYTNRNAVAFSSNTNNRNANRLAIQDDGNLVIYNRSNPLWASKDGGGSNSNNNGDRWGFRGGGNINPGYEFRKNNKVYSSNRSYYLVFQNDGNLVLARNNGEPIWSSATDNRASRAAFQDDGNLVVYDSYNKALWSSNSSNRNVTKLSIQDDGNLVIYDNSTPIWSSNTRR